MDSGGTSNSSCEAGGFPAIFVALRSSMPSESWFELSHGDNVLFIWFILLASRGNASSNVGAASLLLPFMEQLFFCCLRCPLLRWAGEI